jgi:predicted Zn-dependent peptidase
VKTITPEEINITANKYLDWNAMTKVIVGKK